MYYQISLVANVEPRPHLIRVVTGGFPRVQEALQLGHGQDRRDALRVLPVRTPGAAPGPGEPGHERHLPGHPDACLLASVRE